MAAGSLVSHRMTQHGKAKADKWSWNKSATGGGETRTYWIEFPTKGGTRGCPVEGCPGRAETRTAMRIHFCRRHVRDIVIILEEGNLPHPRCSRCDMLVPWRTLNGKHHGTAMCRSGAERSGRDDDWRRQSCGKARRWPSSFPTALSPPVTVSSAPTHSCTLQYRDVSR